MAMLDALSLADALGHCGGNQVASALIQYEREMLARTRRYVLLSRRAAQEMHSRNRIAQLIRDAKLRLADRYMLAHKHSWV